MAANVGLPSGFELDQQAPTLPEGFAVDQSPSEQPQQEAPVMAQVGRGMMDVYQGATQLGLHAADLVGRVDKLVDDNIENKALNGAAKAGLMGLAVMFPSVGGAYVASKFIPEGYVDAYDKKIKDEISLYNEGNKGIQLARIAGNLATPISLIPGAKEASLSKSVLLGIPMGATFAATQPVTGEDFWKGKGEQAAIGAAVGAAAPLAAKAVSGVVNFVKEIITPLSNNLIYKDVAKFLQNNIVENKDKIMDAMHKSILRGENKTVGQVIAGEVKNSADDFGGLLVKLEQDLSRKSDSLKSQYAMQSASHRTVLDNLAGTADDLNAAIALRDGNAQRLYQEAYKEGGIKVIPDNKLISALKNKYGKLAINTANDIAEAKGVSPATNYTEYLHYVKEGLDKQLSTNVGQTPLARSEREAIKATKDSLMKWLENKNPIYGAARNQYKLDSAPINKMQVGKVLKDAYQNALDSPTAPKFASTVKDAQKIIKNSLGDERYQKITDILSKDELDGLTKIVSDLSTNKQASKMAAASESIMGKLSGEMTVDIPHILSRPVVVTNFILKKMGQDKAPVYREVLAKALKDPQEFARIYGGPSNSKATQAAIDIANRLSQQIPAQSMGRTQ